MNISYGSVQSILTYNLQIQNLFLDSRSLTDGQKGKHIVFFDGEGTVRPGFFQEEQL